MRATLELDADGAPIAAPLPDQDSSLVKMLARADGLIIRPTGAPAAAAGALCRVIRL